METSFGETTPGVVNVKPSFKEQINEAMEVGILIGRKEAFVRFKDLMAAEIQGIEEATDKAFAGRGLAPGEHESRPPDPVEEDGPMEKATAGVKRRRS